MEITTIDNRVAYEAKLHALFMKLPAVEFIETTEEHFARRAVGRKFQHKLRVEREVKRRMSLEVRDVTHNS